MGSVTRSLCGSLPTHTEIDRQKNPYPHVLKFVTDVGIGVEQNNFALRTTPTYPRVKAVVVERPVDGRRK
jgi:hypothetical protein